MTWDWEVVPGFEITDIPSVPDDFTPTFEEWFWSTIFPGPIWEKSGEQMMYFSINVSMATFALWYYQGETLAGLRVMKAIQSAPAFFRASPPLVAATAALVVSQDLTERTIANTSRGRPALHGILPIPVYH